MQITKENNSVKAEGKGGISAKVIKHSISASGKEMLTYEFVFPRFILAEVNTHRMLSKGAASSRAVPIADTILAIEQNPALPIHWGQNNAGMSSNGELQGTALVSAKQLWKSAVDAAIGLARAASSKTGVNGHKQWVARMIENYTFTKQVISGTEWANLFWLRDHEAAQPEFRELARCAKVAYQESVPTLLYPGQWHLPYIDFDGVNYYTSKEVVSLEVAKQISASCCAQVSYRKLDDSIEKAQKVFSMLNIGHETEAPHATPTEHQATPMSDSTDLINVPFNPNTWQNGITHVRKDGSMWSGNLSGYVQYRQLIPNESKQ